MVVLVTRMSLDLHQETVDLLRLMGAADHYVGRQFEQHALSNALRGGLFGFTAAIMTVSGYMVALAAGPDSGVAAARARPGRLAAVGLRAGRGGPADGARRSADGALGSGATALGSLAKRGPGSFLPACLEPGSTAALSVSPVVALRSLLFDLFFYVLDDRLLPGRPARLSVLSKRR